MEITFTKISDDRHALGVTRDDGSTERLELDSRSFLRHDLAHLAAELELGLRGGFWGHVAAGASLHGEGLDGPEIHIAETLAGPLQTLMRVEAGPDEIRHVLERVVPDRATDVDAARIHERIRRLVGHWKATPYGSDMVVAWPMETSAS